MSQVSREFIYRFHLTEAKRSIAVIAVEFGYPVWGTVWGWRLPRPR